jgi:hypothetical protein
MKIQLRKAVMALAIVAPMVASTGLSAQEEENETYIYATYFYCNTAKQEKADDWIEKYGAPVYDAAVKDGTIDGWGWLSHHTGGKWRRLQYHTSSSVAGLLKAQEVMAESVAKAAGDDDGIGEVCSSHDDYIWQVEAGNSTKAKRGTAGLSVYHVCDIANEERADEIVEKVFAPIYDKALAAGKISSWGWDSHMVGGKYRRLATMTGKDFESVLKARGEILQEIYGDGDNEEANEFSNICTSHSDYLWEIMHEARKG